MSGVREQVGLRRVFDPSVACPAGLPIAETARGSGCRCRVAHESVCADTDPSSLAAFCTHAHGYRACPTWIAEKERIEAQRREPLVPA